MPTKRILRPLIAAGRGFKRIGNAVVHATKIATKRQLTQRQINKIKAGRIRREKPSVLTGTMTNAGEVESEKIRVTKFWETGGRLQILDYTPEGRLRKKTICPSLGGGPKTETEYSPAGRFKGKRRK